MLQAFSTPHNRRISFTLLSAALLLLLVTFAIGIDDNLLGVTFGMLTVFAGILAVIHPWRTEVPFRYMLWGALAAIVPCGILAGVFESLGNNMTTGSIYHPIVNTLNIFFFVVALFVFPPAFLIGLIGAVIMNLRGRKIRADRSTSHV